MKKIIILCVICLFVGMCFQPAYAVEIPEKEEFDPKDYLYDTIVVIANNPDVQDLLKEYKNNINFDYSGKYLFRQLLFKNPKLLFSMVFTKPKMTTQHLDKTYNQGTELVDIFGEEKALEMLDSVDLINPELSEDLNNIIMNDEDLSNRIITLSELNVNVIICIILFLLFVPTVALIVLFYFLGSLFPENSIWWNFFGLSVEVLFFLAVILFILIVFDFECIYSPI